MLMPKEQAETPRKMRSINSLTLAFKILIFFHISAHIQPFERFQLALKIVLEFPRITNFSQSTINNKYKTIWVKFS